MPVPSLPPFFTFRPDNFHIGGSVSTLMAAAVRWRTFGDSALEAASAMRSINDGGFEGSEGDRFRELVNGDFPSNLQVTGDAHVGVADAISRYATLLSERKAEMATLETTARGSHAAVNAAAANVNAAEAALAAAPDPATKSAAAAALAAAVAEHQAALGVWEGNLATAQGIRTMLGTDAEAQAAIIDTQSRKAFKDNPKPWEAAWDAVSDWLNEHGDILSFIADALQIVGAIAMFICPVVGAVLLGIGVGLKGLLAAAGVVSWGEFAFDLATAGPLGVLGKAVKAGKLGTTAAKGLNKISSVGAKSLASIKANSGTATRGIRTCLGMDPVDMATGNMVDFETDVFIDGILPLVIDRNANTNYELGRALGPRWVSTMDIRLEITFDEILMLSPDGALLTFPPAPTDGSEVRADGRPWLLSYADGTYRVRNIADGLTYGFRLFDLEDRRENIPSVGVRDESPSLGGSYVGAVVPKGSLAEAADSGMEICLSSVVHHTGASIDYMWDIATGHMVRMRRSDDTIIDLEWDNAVGRVAHVYVSNPTTHPGEDRMRLVSYAYDAYGQLIRVINSSDGALEYRYDEHGRMNAWTDRNGVSYHYRFDDHGRVRSQVGTGGAFPNIAYWADDEGDDAPEGGRVCVAIETAGEFKGEPLDLGDGIVDEYFDRLEQLPLYKALVKDGLASAGLTGRGRTSSRDDETWTLPPEWLHDDFLGDIRPTVYRSTLAGDVWRIVTPEGGIEDASYNEFHQKTSITNSAGATTSYTFNRDGVLMTAEFPGGVTSAIEPGEWATPVRIVGTDGLATEFEVDAFGMVITATSASGETTTCEYEVRPSGIVPSAITDSNGLTAVIESDDAGRVIAMTDTAGRRTSILRDVRGLPVETIDPAGYSTCIEYTPEGWPELVTHPDGTQISAVYDGEGNQLSSTNEIGVMTTSSFTVFDKLSATTDATGATTHLEYNTQMEPIRLVNADANKWHYYYDLDGKVVGEVDYNDISTTNTFSADGLTSTVTTPAGTTERVRHADGRIDTITDALGTNHFLYDHVNRLVAIEGPQASIDFVRDELGRITAEIVTLASGESTTHAFSIGNDGHVEAEHLTLPLGETITTTNVRNFAGEIARTAYRHTPSGAEHSELIAEVSYGKDERGIRNRLSTGAVTRNISCDTRGRTTGDTLALLDSSAEGGLQTIASRKFTWREDSALSMIADSLRGTSTFKLDGGGRATRLIHNPISSDIGIGGDEGNLVEERYGFTVAGILNLIDAQDPRSHSSSISGAAVNDHVEFSGTMPTRVGRTSYRYDAAGRVTQTITKRVSEKPLVKNFFYSTGEQPIGFSSSDEPERGYRYVYDPLGRRVAKEQIDTDTGELKRRTIYAHFGDRLAAEQIVVSDQKDLLGIGYMWTTDPESGSLIGQIRLNPSIVSGRTARLTDKANADYVLVLTDLAGAPRELVAPDSGRVVGLATQTLYGVRTWHGNASSPLLYEGQYLDKESGWAYNRFRYFDPSAGIYNAQDPLGVAPRIASAQGYVDHAGHWVDVLGLKQCDKQWIKRVVNDKVVYQQLGDHVFNPKKMLWKPKELRTGFFDRRWSNAERMAATGKAPIGRDGEPVQLHHIGQDDRSAVVEITETLHQTESKTLHIYSGLPSEKWPSDVIPVDRAAFGTWRKSYWKTRGMEYLNGQ